MLYRAEINGVMFNMFSVAGENVEVEFSGNYSPQIIRDYENRIIRKKANVDLLFRGAAREYVEDLIIDNECNQITANLWAAYNENSEWYNEWSGIINLPDYVLIRQSKDGRQLKFEVLDNQFQSFLLKNWNIATSTFALNSVSGDSINRIEPVPMLFLAINDFPEIKTALGYKAYNLMSFLTSFVFDGSIELKSDFLDNTQLYVGLIRHLRLNSEDPYFEVSFKELFDELSVIYNLWIGFENGKLVIENESYFRESAIHAVYDCLTDFESEQNLDLLYSSAVLGASTTTNRADSVEDAPTYPMNQELNTWLEKEYVFSGGCKVDNKLSLVNNFVIDHNTLEDVIVNNNDIHDDLIYFIEVNDVLGIITARAFQSGLSTVFYNQGLMNAAKSENWFCGFQLDNELISFEGIIDELKLVPTFNLDLVTSIQFLAPLPIDSVIYENKIVQSPTNGVLIVDRDRTVNVRMSVTYEFSVLYTLFPETIYFYLGFNVYDSLPVFSTLPVIDNSREWQSQPPPSSMLQEVFEYEIENFLLLQGKLFYPMFLVLHTTAATFTVTRIVDYSLSVVDSRTGALLYDTNCSYPSTFNKFVKKITLDEWLSISLNQKKRFNLIDGNELIEGWLQDFEFDSENGILRGVTASNGFVKSPRLELREAVIIPNVGNDIFDETFDLSFN